MELGFKPGTGGSKVLELRLLAVGEKGRLGGSPALSDLLKTLGEREKDMATHLQYSCLGNHMVRGA